MTEQAFQQAGFSMLGANQSEAHGQQGGKQSTFQHWEGSILTNNPRKHFYGSHPCLSSPSFSQLNPFAQFAP